MDTIRNIWRAINVDVAVLAVMVIVLLSHPEEWSQFVIDWVLP